MFHIERRGVKLFLPLQLILAKLRAVDRLDHGQPLPAMKRLRLGVSLARSMQPGCDPRLLPGLLVSDHGAPDRIGVAPA
ncbi:MAG: hypothetical protein JEY79_17985 [Pseudodesulfovibrio sp.]|nr:hypothetical protein [Pseudodesulfovibrio sp.]